MSQVSTAERKVRISPICIGPGWLFSFTQLQNRQAPVFLSSTWNTSLLRSRSNQDLESHDLLAPCPAEWEQFLWCHTLESSSVVLPWGGRAAKSWNISSSFNMCCKQKGQDSLKRLPRPHKQEWTAKPWGGGVTAPQSGGKRHSCLSESDQPFMFYLIKSRQNHLAETKSKSAHCLNGRAPGNPMEAPSGSRMEETEVQMQ